MTSQTDWPTESREVSWISSAALPNGNLRIARTTANGDSSEVTWLTDSPHNDYKPVISPDGRKIAFFRTYREDPSFYKWQSAICVMDIDGSNLRELTGHTFMNTEPYWMRDGSDRVIWSRMVDASLGAQGTYAFMTHCDAAPGDEAQISATNWEWINSGLRDGRVFIKQRNAYFLMRPNPGGEPAYEEIDYPDAFHYLHKVALSNDETMIAYMKKVDSKGDDYLGSEIVYAKFDASAPAITDEVVFSPKDESKFSWYVSIAPDNTYLIFAENGTIMQFDVASGKTRQLSTRADIQYRYPTIMGTIK